MMAIVGPAIIATERNGAQPQGIPLLSLSGGGNDDGFPLGHNPGRKRGQSPQFCRVDPAWLMRRRFNRLEFVAGAGWYLFSEVKKRTSPTEQDHFQLICHVNRVVALHGCGGRGIRP